MKDSPISRRKRDHVKLCVNDDVEYAITSGFERYTLLHNALPEINLANVNTSVSFLNHHISAPIFISSMTGGYLGAESINAKIARVCQELRLPFGVGSQRSMIEHPEERVSFSVARKVAPECFIAANIGGVQLVKDFGLDSVKIAIDSVEANALVIHLNPLQELIQEGGDTNFVGILDAIGRLARQISIPIIVKETGAGISGTIADQLFNVGVSAVDVAGAGGTSWSKVERLRKDGLGFSDFDNWGIPTAECLRQISFLRRYDKKIISSGGVYTISDMLISLALGADVVALARPIIQKLHQEGEEGLHKYLAALIGNIAKGCLLLGVSSPSELSHHHLIDNW